MSIILKHQSGYKSIDDIGHHELPDFVVLTGLNGSGKSQLLESILNSNTGIQVFDGKRELLKKKHVTHATLVPTNTGAVDSNQLRQSANNIYVQYKKYRDQWNSNHLLKLEQVIGDANQQRLIKFIAKEAGKDVGDLEADDFFEYYPIDDGLVVSIKQGSENNYC